MGDHFGATYQNLNAYQFDVLHASRDVVGVAITIQYAFATVGLVLSGFLADAIGLRCTVILICIANVVLLNLVGNLVETLTRGEAFLIL